MEAAGGLKFDCTLGEQLQTLNEQKNQSGSGSGSGAHQQKKEPRYCGPKNILLVEGSKEDRQLSDTNTALLERVWILSRPPQNLKDPQPTVSARRVQIVRCILDGEFAEAKVCPPVPPECKGGSDSTPGSTRPSSRSVSIVGGA